MIKNLYPTFLLALLLPAIKAQGQIAFTANTNLLSGSYGNPSCVADVNGDGLDDISRFSGTQLFVAYQQADGSFLQQSYGNATVSPNWSLCAGDLNGDGFLDFLIGNGSANSFLWSNGDGTGYTEQYFPDYIFSQRTNMLDFDGDGLLDAFSCHDVGLSRPYRNLGNNTLAVDHSLLNQVTTVGGNYSSSFNDLDNDGDLDLYITKCRSGAPLGDPQRINLHYRNNGDGTWTEIGALSGLNDGAQSWTHCVEDFNNDGFFDIFILNHTDGHRLMMNNGDGTFTNTIVGSGIPVGPNTVREAVGGDFDNDGWIDLFTQVGGGMYRNNGDGTFTEMTLEQKHGGVGDLNNDGWLDYHLGGTVYLNNGGSNHWIKVDLEGIFSNKNGIGARLWLYGDWGVQTREIRSGTTFSHMSSLQAHFGIGQATSIDSLVINWPSGVRTVLENPAIDQLHVVPEANCTVAPITITAQGGTSLCPGGSVTLEAPDGFESYNWSNGGSGSSVEASQPGNYSVTAFDADGCASISNSIVVQMVQEQVPEVSLVGEELICEGSTVELVSSITIAPVWSDGTLGAVLVTGEAGTYTVTVPGICGPVTSAAVTIAVNPAPAEPQADDVTIPAAGTAQLSAIGENVLWYDDPQASTAIGSGSPWESPFVAGVTVFWAESNALYGGELMDGGKPDNSGAGGLPSSGSHSFFDAWEPFTIETVVVYAIGSGNRTVNLCDADGAVLQSAQFDLTEGTHTLTLDFEVPVGTNLSLRCPQHSLFRNSSGVSYPYPVGTMGELTTSGFGPSWYYYFYDWKVRNAEMWCPSDRVPVTVFVGNVGIGDAEAQGVRVYPVPALEELRVDGVRAGERVELLDAGGRLVRGTSATVDGTLVLPVVDLAPGLYMLCVSGGDRRVVREVSVLR